MPDTQHCETCFAQINVDYYFEHQEWHESLRDFIRGPE